MNLTSGNEMVDAMAEINFSGNIVPEAWFKNVLRPNGKPHLLAITILSDIVYWYRPTEERDENTGHIIGWKKKFKGDLLQKSYKAYSNMYGESKDSVKAAFDILENNGLVKRYLRDVELADGSIRPNVMYIELFTDAVKRITFDIPQEKKDDIPEKIASYPPKFSGRVAKENGDICENDAICSVDETDTLPGNFSPYPEMNQGTITENILENNTENTSKNLSENKTEINNTDGSHSFTSFTHSIGDRENESDRASDGEINQTKYEYYSNLIKKNIDFDKLIYNHQANKRLIRRMVEVMATALSSGKPYIFVAKENRSIRELEKVYLSLENKHIEHVLQNLPDVDSDVNVCYKDKYLMAFLFNAPSTIDQICVTHQIKVDKSKPGYSPMMRNEYDWETLEDELLGNF